MDTHKKILKHILKKEYKNSNRFMLSLMHLVLYNYFRYKYLKNY